MAPEQGIYRGVPFAAYRAWDAVNSHLLSTLRSKSEMHAKFERDNPQEPTPDMIAGRAFHTLVLEPQLFQEEFIVAPRVDKRTKDGKEKWAAFETTAGERTVISSDDYAQMRAWQEAIMAHPMASAQIVGGTAEVSMVWSDKETGLLCKGRADYWHEKHGLIIDLKTASNASPSAFAAASASYWYHLQAAYYVDGMSQLTGEAVGLVFVVVEKDPPYGVAVYQPSDGFEEAGRAAYRSALDRWAEAGRLGHWPGYSTEGEIIELPVWAMRREGVAA